VDGNKNKYNRIRQELRHLVAKELGGIEEVRMGMK
jgi:hypothetical protein